MKKLFTAFLFVLASTFALAQNSVTGTVVDAESGEPLIGAAVLVKGTTTGTITDFNGKFMLGLEDKADYTLVFTYTGYTEMEKVVSVNGKTDLGKVGLEFGVGLNEIEVVASYAIERRTPVAFSQLEKKQIEKVLGSRDIPLALNLTPSVYSTEQGGGAGDARINVRGFDQRNVAVMINGVPVNDMENGWVYWSNWDGIADAASSIQLQRGLSSVNLATPSIGGTLNIVTSPADKKAGGAARFEVGNAGFMKFTVTGHSGMINDKFAISASAVRKVGKGIVDKTWTDSWAYYFGATFKANDKHTFELFGLGAPQRHGQNLYKQNIAAYGHEFASSIDSYDKAALESFPEAAGISNMPDVTDGKDSRYYNENWNTVSDSYTGQQAVGDRTFDRHDPNFLNERENFYHKPLVNLNWYADWSDKVRQYTTVYWSGGTGGGSGTIGSMKYNYHEGISSPSRIVMWDATIANNIANGSDGSAGVIRNSRNDQNTIGAISKFKIDWSKNFKSTVGVDWRTATIDHYREVRDLLGGQFYIDNSDDFNPNNQAGLGDKIAYYNTNNVDWIGGFLQSEYSVGAFSAYAMVGYSQIKYDFTDHFKMASDGSEYFAETDWISGIQVKGGANYRVNNNFNVFANLGYVDKVPIFDAVIDDYTGAVAQNAKNEKFQAFEAGANFFSNDNKFVARLSGYYTNWQDRTKTIGVYDPTTDEDGIVFITGMDQLHTGIELDMKYKPVEMLEIGLTGSLANWTNTNDVSGTYDPDGNGPEGTETLNFYVKDLYVGDAPQNQLVASLRVFPVDGLEIAGVYSYYSKHYAQWDPFSRSDASDKSQSWQAPNYGLLNFHVNYDFNFGERYGVTLFAHVFNSLDEIYISDAVDNSRYNAYKVDGSIANPHQADAAEVFLGTPRKFNVGFKLNF